MRTYHPALDYIRTLYAKEDALLIRIREALEARNIAWQVGAEEGRLLQWLIRLHGAKKVVEIGTLGGYAAIWMARGLPEDGHLITIEKNAEHVRLAREFIASSDVAGHIAVREGDAHAVLKELALTSPFDMVFIDADKASYNAYLDWAEVNIRSGGLIVADNTLLFGNVYLDAPKEGIAVATWQEMRRFNERLADEQKYFAMLIPTAEGLSVAIKR